MNLFLELREGETEQERSLEAFTKALYPPFQSAEHIRELIGALERTVKKENGRLIVTMPPRHSKSLNVSEHLPAWYLGNHPNNRVIAASHTAALAYTFSRRVRGKFKATEWPFDKVHVADDKGAVSAWDIADYRGGYLSVGVGGSPTGVGGDLIIIDDPIRSQADADSETIREAIWEWYQGTMRTRLEPGGSIIVTATRWHDEDLTGRLLDAESKGGEEWEHIQMPAINEWGHALWPERWPIEALLKIKEAVGSRVFEAQYQGRPVAGEGGTFKHDWWQTYTEVPPLRAIDITVDSAFKAGIANDYSVFAAWGFDFVDRAYLLNVWRKRVEFPELIRLGYAAHSWATSAYPSVASLLVVEDQASGQSAIQTWHRGDYGNPLPVTAYSVNGIPKLSRAEAVTPLIEGSRVYIPEHAPWLDDWMLEHDRYPTGKFDDQVDTTAMALSRLMNRNSSWADMSEQSAGQWARSFGI
jgi:predicted phage terminase large subunit-like protein